MSTADQQRGLRVDDELQGAGPPGGQLDLSGLVGSWLNTDRGSSGGVLRFVVSDRGGRLYVHGFGAGDPEPYDWGEIEGTPFAPSVADGHAWAFNCRFELGFLQTDVSAYNKEGVLVVVTYNSFDDDSGRADYWTREFFYREAPA